MKPALFLSLFLLLSACASSSTHEEARALAISVAEAIEGSTDCTSMAARLDATLAPQSSRIASLARATTPEGEGAPNADEQRRLLRMARRARDCRGTAPDSLAALALAPLAQLATRPPAPSDGSRYDCADDCCAQSWQTWAEVPYFTTACLTGNDYACCMAVTISSQEACRGLYCLTNDCCTAERPRRRDS
ncbi:MAG TPA: hypothetical protein VF266_07445 [Thermoanaerobaculia bacterium]